MKFNVEKYNNIKSLVQSELTDIEQMICDFNNVNTELNDTLLEYLKAPSKKIRSVITLLYLKAKNIEITEDIKKLLAVVELVHNASIIHDDVIDKADTRRDEQTINSKLTNSMAVISGDFILSIAIEKLLSLQKLEILEIFIKTIQKMCKSEIYQYYTKYKIPELEKYIEKSEYKTAILFECALICSAILSNTDKEKAKDFGKNFGIAFQIRDDILNFEKSDNKPVNNDIKDGIYTAPVIFAQNLEDLAEGLEKSKQLLDNYLEEATKDIAQLGESTYKTAILELLDLMKI